MNTKIIYILLLILLIIFVLYRYQVKDTNIESFSDEKLDHWSKLTPGDVKIIQVNPKYAKNCVDNLAKELHPKSEKFYKYNSDLNQLQMHQPEPNIKSCTAINLNTKNVELKNKIKGKQKIINSLEKELYGMDIDAK